MIMAFLIRIFGDIGSKIFVGIVAASIVGGAVYLIKDAVDGYNTLIAERQQFKNDVIRLGQELATKEKQIQFMKDSAAITETVDKDISNFSFSNATTLTNDVFTIAKAGNHETSAEPRCKDRIIPMPPAMSVALERLWRNAQGRNTDTGIQK